jgi:uncharacterized repeat protein (TIGR03803 family)
MSKPMLRISNKFGCGLALALLIPVGGAHAKSTETVLYSFTGGADGSNPFAGLIKDASGNLYGTTVEGGAHGLGTVFKLAPDGTETALWSFTGADGSYPEGGLIMDTSGNLYGTTSSGGADGDGTVFEVALNGAETVLHSFTGGSDGKGPQAGLIMDKKGKLYGTTLFGGANGDGTVFKVAPGGAETVLYSFTGKADGSLPGAGLIRRNGNFYGTTEGGGAENLGTVFKLSPDGTETVLYSFCPNYPDCSDGVLPVGGLIADSAGNLFGTTSADGGGGGTVFKLAPDGTETTLWSFTGGADGSEPQAGLVRENGNLYGTTLLGGANGLGTVFKVARDGTETVLYSFDSVANAADGFEPYAGLIKDESGNLYGTTYAGGADANGVVFKITKR